MLLSHCYIKGVGLKCSKKRELGIRDVRFGGKVKDDGIGWIFEDENILVGESCNTRKIHLII